MSKSFKKDGAVRKMKRHTALWESNHHPFLWLLLPFALGILTQYLLAQKLQALQLWLALILFLCSSVLSHLFRQTQNWIRLARTISMLLLMYSFGLLISHYQDIRQHKNWYGHYVKEAQAFKVSIIQAPEKKARTLYLPSAVTAVKVEDSWLQVKGKMKLYVYLNDSLPDYKIGGSIVLPNKMIPIQNSGNPFNFDYAGFAARNNLYHQAFVAAHEILYLDNHSGNKSSLIASISASMFQDIKENIRDSTTQSLVAAVLLNERSMMADELWQAYSATGIIHIIAISGMHVVLLFVVFQFLLSWIKNKRLNWLKYLLAVPLVWMYIALTNYPPSAIRAGLTFTLVAISVLALRKGNALNSWAAVGFLMLCYNPYWLFNIGVQLSFLAVLSIMLFYTPIRRWYQPRTKIGRYIWSSFSVSLAAQLLVFPLVIYYFHQFPLWVLIVNIPAAAYSFLLMVGALVLCTLASIGIPCIWLGEVLTYCTQIFHSIILFFAQYTPQSLRSLFIDSIDFWLLFISAVLFYYAVYYRKYRPLLIGMFTTQLLIISLFIQDWQALGQRRLVVYNVSRLSLADVFEGKEVRSLGYNADTIENKTWQYVLLPARLGYRSMKLAPATSTSEIEQIGPFKILFLHKSYRSKSTETTFPVDFLVLSNDCIYQPEIWLGVFCPRKIILDGSLPRWKAQKWKKELAEFQVPVHWVQEDGAFIVSSF